MSIRRNEMNEKDTRRRRRVGMKKKKGELLRIVGRV